MMEKIKVIHVINYLTNGGPSKVLSNITSGLPKDKFEIKVVTILKRNNKQIVNELNREGIEVIELDYIKNNLSIFLKSKKIAESLRKLNPDILHVHGIELSYVAGLLSKYCHTVTTIHNCLFDDYRYSYGILFGAIIERMHIHFLKKIELNICCSKTVYETLLNKKIKNIKYVRNGDTIDAWPSKNRISRKKMNLGKSDIIYVYCGVISKRKQVRQLINTFNEVSREDEKLIIVGGGKDFKACKKIASRKDKVILVGPRNKVEPYLMIGDIYISNSKSEGLSMSILEAMGNGLLCLLSKIPSHEEVLQINDKYYVGECFVANRIRESMDSVRERLGAQNRKQVVRYQKEYLSKESMSNGYAKLYYETMGVNNG